MNIFSLPGMYVTPVKVNKNLTTVESVPYSVKKLLQVKILTCQTPNAETTLKLYLQIVSAEIYMSHNLFFYSEFFFHF